MMNNMLGLTFVWQEHKLSVYMRNRFGWLGRGTITWGLLNQLISDLPFDTILIGYQYSTFSHCGIPRFTFCCWESTLSLHATYCHCNIHLTFSNTTFYSNINKWQLSINTVTRIDRHIHQSTHITYKLHTYIHILSKNNLNKLYQKLLN